MAAAAMVVIITVTIYARSRCTSNVRTGASINMEAKASATKRYNK